MSRIQYMPIKVKGFTMIYSNGGYIVREGPVNNIHLMKWLFNIHINLILHVLNIKVLVVGVSVHVRACLFVACSPIKD